ncbi:MAG TPA: radical SAM protein [Candidatus Faecisoma merdavium]|nr:radical SAM protein [Candidatus Faecisoma merdavium]
MQIAVDKNNNVYELSTLNIMKSDNIFLKQGINNLSEKEKLLKAKSLILVHSKTKRVIFELNMIQNQHFFPLSILDYANTMLKFMKKEINEFPIMSLDSHDYNFCDFNCKDCLAVDTRKWAKDNLGFTNFDINHYEKVLKEIARYSKKRGLDSIRFEMSGEGNPDMYPNRARLIKYAKEECNMRCVYISSGSQLDEKTIDALAKYAYYIRISFPGINNVSYEKYSAQIKKEKQFTYDNAIELIKKLVKKRKEYGREGELMIGARTCMRPENSGSYLETAKTLGKIGVDSFQIVKILIPIGLDIEKYKLDSTTIEELTNLHDNYANYGLLHVQVPHDLDYIYYDRQIDEKQKPSQCYSSMVSPILYGPNLIICTHWEKIKDVKESHYGYLTGKENELENIMNNEHANHIRKCVPEKCSSCCAIYDNQMLEMIRSQLSLVSNLDDVEFLLTY